MPAAASPKPSRISAAVRQALAGHMAAGLAVSETLVEIEGRKISVRIRTSSQADLTDDAEGALLSVVMAGQMGQPATRGARGNGKRAG